MKRGYMRPMPSLPEDVQVAALRTQGVTDFTPEGPVYTDALTVRKTRKATPADLPERAAAVRSLRRNDRLVVSDMSVLALDQADFVSVMQAISEAGAWLVDASDGKEHRWHPEALSMAAALAKFLASKKGAQTRNARAAATAARTKMGLKVGRMPVMTPKMREEAEPLWRDLSVPAKEVARRIGVSVSTLYNTFKGRTETPAKRRTRRK